MTPTKYLDFSSVSCSSFVRQSHINGAHKFTEPNGVKNNILIAELYSLFERYSEGISLLSSLQNHSLELTRKVRPPLLCTRSDAASLISTPFVQVALYCIPGTGKLGLTKDGVEDAEGAAKLRAVRDLVRRLTVQLAVLVGTDIQVPSMFAVCLLHYSTN